MRPQLRVTAHGWQAPEQFSIHLDRSLALAFCFNAFSSREPVSTSLENALDRV
jgi:hypothetical protein